ncbi:MAG: hypothetical protein JNL21_00575 [Myxococcales bacterium]|nr:hypothetical protein [Myxococcales bacterium]
MKSLGAYALTALVTTGCSLAYDLGSYDEGTASASSTGGFAPSGGGGAGGDATGGGASGGGGAAPECGEQLNPPVSSVKETFDSGFGSVAPVGSCVSVDAGTALFTPPASEPLDFCWVTLPGVLHLSCDALTFRLLEATNAVLGAQTFVYLSDVASGTRTNLILEGGGFQLSLELGGGGIEIMNGIYNPATDRYVRIRADEDTLFLETSIDGAEWVVRGSGPYLMPLDGLQVSIGAGTYSALMSDPGQARIDCINVVPCP